MSYSFNSRVRYSEIGEDKRLTLNGVINYFQDCSTFHSEDVGLGLNKLQELGKGWVLSSWQIVVERYPELCENIVISTWPYAFKGFLGSRNFTIHSESGELLAYANTLWAFMDVLKGRPTVVTKEFIEGYELEPPLDMDYASRKVAVPKESAAGEPFPVRACHLDTNHHVNNGQYVQMAREFIPKDYPVYQLRAEYKRQAKLGDIITPRVHEKTNGYTVALCQSSTQGADGALKSDGEPYAVVEFTREEIV